MVKVEPGPADARPPYHHGDLRRALVEAATALVADEQDWSFSLREVARRANVSHNAPYNHFADRQDLLAAVAVAGYEALRLRLVATADPDMTPKEALVAIGAGYVRFGTENPARYRLMFGSALGSAEEGMPAVVIEAAGGARAVLEGVVRRGADDASFAVASDDGASVGATVVAAWAVVHGLTMLLIDGLATAGGSGPQPDGQAESILRIMIEGIAPNRGGVRRS